jgi:hypothetical protein
MTSTVKVGRRLDLQLGSLDIAIYDAPSLQSQEVLNLDRSGHLAHDIRLLAADITLDIAISADDNLRSTMDIAHERAVDTQITTAGNVAFHSRTRAYQAGTGACGLFCPKLKPFGFSLSVKHKYGILVIDFLRFRDLQSRRIQLHGRITLQHIPNALQILVLIPHLLL